MPHSRGQEHRAELEVIARRWGGAILSRLYVNDTTKLEFRCAEGHRFLAAPTHVKQGRWCPPCGQVRKAEARSAPARARHLEVVEQHGGTLLSPKYVNNNTKLSYRCSLGHEWSTVPAVILAGGWCPTCANRDRGGLHDARRAAVHHRVAGIVADHGGVLESERYTSRDEGLRVRCAKGHRWAAPAASIEGGAWCRRCHDAELLAAVRHMAGLRGGRCLSRALSAKVQKVELRCSLGHAWSTPAEVLLKGHWCPTCRRPGRDDLDHMKRLAAAQGGACLSTQYVNSETKLRWRCREGHAWEAMPGSIVQGSWCRICTRGWGKSRARLSIEVMREIAAEKGGTCLSTTYNGIYDRLRWKCARRHVWETPANNVRRGAWCPTCAHSTRGTLAGMQVLAHERGGRCVSRAWDDHRTPLRFECGRGHRFTALARAVKSGVWCPECAPAG